MIPRHALSSYKLGAIDDGKLKHKCQYLFDKFNQKEANRAYLQKTVLQHLSDPDTWPDSLG